MNIKKKTQLLSKNKLNQNLQYMYQITSSYPYFLLHLFFCAMIIKTLHKKNKITSIFEHLTNQRKLNRAPISGQPRNNITYLINKLDIISKKWKKKHYTEDEIFQLLGIQKENLEKKNKKIITNKNSKNQNKKDIKTKKLKTNISNDEKGNKTNLKKDNINNIGNYKKGLPDKKCVVEKYKNNCGNIFNLEDFYLQNVTGDGNCGYRYISLQIYGTEEKYDSIRQDIYSYLTLNKKCIKIYLLN